MEHIDKALRIAVTPPPVAMRNGMRPHSTAPATCGQRPYLVAFVPPRRWPYWVSVRVLHAAPRPIDAHPKEVVMATRRTRREDGLPSSDFVYRSLKERIISGAIAPNTRLVELGMADEFGVSRTPVREALKRLAAEHLAGRHPGVDAESRPGRPPETGGDRQRALPRRYLRGRRERGAGAHRTRPAEFVRRFTTLPFASSERVEDVLREHIAILAALRNHDPEAAKLKPAATASRGRPGHRHSRVRGGPPAAPGAAAAWRRADRRIHDRSRTVPRAWVRPQRAVPVALAARRCCQYAMCTIVYRGSGGTRLRTRRDPACGPRSPARSCPA